MKYRIYTPQAAYLPSTSPIHRKPLGGRKRLLFRQPPEPADYLQFETHTLVHDIFLAHEAAQVVAIGPPLLNLASELTPVSLTVDCRDIPIKGRVSARERFSFLTFDLPGDLHHRDSMAIQVNFNDRYRYKFNVQRQPFKPVNLQLNTLQKDNEISWIIDWIQYYEHLGVDRILLYDNGSSNFSEIENALQNLASSIDLVLIQWPYLFGPRSSTRNRFCQASRANHALRCFGQAEWDAHFDLDEYLIVQQATGARQESTSGAIDAGALSSLAQETPHRIGQLRFDSYWVPNVGSTSNPRDNSSPPTVRDFLYRENKARGTAHKFLVRQRALRYAKTHNCRLKPVINANSSQVPRRFFSITKR